MSALTTRPEARWLRVSSEASPAIGFDVFSASTEPGYLHPLAVRAMAEIGVDIGTQRSKPVDEFTELRFDYVVTVCDQARETCPIFPGAATQLHWSFRDPAAVEGSEEPRLSAFRSVRNEITAMIQRVILEGPAKEGAS